VDAGVYLTDANNDATRKTNSKAEGESRNSFRSERQKIFKGADFAEYDVASSINVSGFPDSVLAESGRSRRLQCLRGSLLAPMSERQSACTRKAENRNSQAFEGLQSNV
jgi:hypothetical protein